MKIIKQTKQLVALILFAIILYSCSQNNESELNLEQKSNSFINESLANKIANNVLFNTNSESKSTIQKGRKIKEVFPVKDEKKEILFYIINYEKEGFLILSADNRVSPVLAYSENNEFRTNLKSYYSGLSDWLLSTKKVIETIKIKGLKQSKEIKLEWDRFLSEGYVLNQTESNPCGEEIEKIGPLLTTEWGQGCGYNSSMPFIECETESVGISCGRAVAGCVPLAIAQVMKYHNYPEDYNWSYMDDNRGSLSTSNLIGDIHNAFGNRIDYLCFGTAAPSRYVDRVFKNHFNYSSAKRSNYDIATVKQELRLNRPVILSGTETDEEYSHMWVCDGLIRKKICYIDVNGNTVVYPYGASLMFHMNWGWDGTENGWFSFQNFNPNDTYNIRTKMIYEIKP